MRPIVLVQLDKVRPAVLLTRELAVPALANVTVAPITSRVRGIGSEVPVGRVNGLEQECVVSCDNIVTVSKRSVLREVGILLPAQEAQLTAALHHAFDLE